MHGLHHGARALGVLILSLAATHGRAQGGTPSAATRTVLSGIYTTQQAGRGEGTFQETCVACHVTSQFAAPRFLAAWEGARIYDLFELIRTTMPPDEPGSLPRASYASILAYLLQLNSFPPGEFELSAEADSLKQIRVDPPTGAQAASPTRSTLTGVYSASQAAQGQDRYAIMCQGCHTVASHTGPAFVNAWNGRALWDLFDYIIASMPKSDPGSLTPQECAQLVAYLLKMNGFPAGPGDLPADAAALKTIRFETVSPHPGGPGTR